MSEREAKKPSRIEDLPYNKEAHVVYADVEHRAFEKYVFELVKNWAAEHDNLQRKHFGRDAHIVVREVRLKGEYPKTVIRIRVYEPNRDSERWQTHLLWQDPTFFDDEGARLCSPERMAGDILMHARGG
jgi:hypothetical protein